MQCLSQCTVDRDAPFRHLKEIFEQENHRFSLGLPYVMTQSSLRARGTHAVYQTSLYCCMYQLLKLEENECCKMKVHKHVFLWIVGTCLPLPLR